MVKRGSWLARAQTHRAIGRLDNRSLNEHFPHTRRQGWPPPSRHNLDASLILYKLSRVDDGNPQETNVATILEVLSQSGAVPMEELKLRSPGSSAEVERRVAEFEKQGIVEISTDPDLREREALDDDRLVTLTTKGLKSALVSW